MSKFNENLSSHERAVLPLVVDILRSRTGRGHEVSSQMMDDCISSLRGRVESIKEVIAALTAQRDVRFS